MGMKTNIHGKPKSAANALAKKKRSRPAEAADHPAPPVPKTKTAQATASTGRRSVGGRGSKKLAAVGTTTSDDEDDEIIDDEKPKNKPSAKQSAPKGRVSTSGREKHEALFLPCRVPDSALHINNDTATHSGDGDGERIVYISTKGQNDNQLRFTIHSNLNQDGGVQYDNFVFIATSSFETFYLSATNDDKDEEEDAARSGLADVLMLPLDANDEGEPVHFLLDHNQKLFSRTVVHRDGSETSQNLVYSSALQFPLLNDEETTINDLVVGVSLFKSGDQVTINHAE